MISEIRVFIERGMNGQHSLVLASFIINSPEVGNLDERMSRQSKRVHDEDTVPLTLASMSWANDTFPTRGVPYVTTLMDVDDGRFRVKNRESSSAKAPPREWPIYKGS